MDNIQKIIIIAILLLAFKFLILDCPKKQSLEHYGGARSNFEGGAGNHGGTHFPWSDGKNYISANDTMVRGNLNVSNKLIVGNKFRLTAGHDGQANDTWTRLLKPKSNTYADFAVGKLYTGGDIQSTQNTYFKGGTGNHGGTHFPYSDGRNYISANETMVRGNMNINGTLSGSNNGRLMVSGTTHFGGENAGKGGTHFPWTNGHNYISAPENHIRGNMDVSGTSLLKNTTVNGNIDIKGDITCPAITEIKDDISQTSEKLDKLINILTE